MPSLRNPVDFVPPEIWTIIFANLLFSEQSENLDKYCKSDIYSCYMVCPLFRNILNATKTTWMFQEVVPMIAPYLRRSDILQSRNICKLWKKGVDQYLENQDIIVSNNSYTRKQKPRASKYLICKFATSVKISRFLEDMQSHPGNPFPGRTLSLAFGTEPIGRQLNRGYAEFWNSSAFELLLRFGDHITTLHIKLCFKNTAWTKYSLRQLKFMLETTPNLRSLHLQGYSPCHYETDKDMRNWAELLPYLPTLTYLKFTSQRCLTHWYCNSIPIAVQYFIGHHHFQHLRRLEISFADWPGKAVQAYPAIMPYLEVLRVKVVCATQLLDIFKPDTGHLSQLRSVTIEIVKFKHSHIEQERLGHILYLIHTFKENIRELVILAEDEEYKDVSESSAWDLEILKEFKQLKYLRIQGFFFANFPTINWLPEKLEYLYLGGANENHSYDQDELEIDMEETGLLEWNLPRLGIGSWNSGISRVRSTRKDILGSKNQFRLVILTLIFILILLIFRSMKMT